MPGYDHCAPLRCLYWVLGGGQAGAEGGHWQVGVLGHFAQTGDASSIQYRWVDNIDRIIMIIRNTFKLARVDNPTFLFFFTSLIINIFLLILTRVGGPTFLICNVSLVLYFLFPEILQTLSVDTNLIILFFRVPR